MTRTWWIVAVLAIAGCKKGNDKLDRAKLDAIVHKADACKDAACVDAAFEEYKAVYRDQTNSSGGTSEDDMKYLTAAGDVIKTKQATFKK